MQMHTRVGMHMPPVRLDPLLEWYIQVNSAPDAYVCTSAKHSKLNYELTSAAICRAVSGAGLPAKCCR